MLISNTEKSYSTNVDHVPKHVSEYLVANGGLKVKKRKLFVYVYAI